MNTIKFFLALSVGLLREERPDDWHTAENRHLINVFNARAADQRPQANTSSLLMITELVILLVLINGVSPGFCGFCNVSFFRFNLRRTELPQIDLRCHIQFQCHIFITFVVNGVTVFCTASCCVRTRLRWHHLSDFNCCLLIIQHHNLRRRKNIHASFILGAW